MRASCEKEMTVPNEAMKKVIICPSSLDLGMNKP